MENKQNTIPNADKSGQGKRNVPTLRFPEFTDEWRISSFSNVFNIISNNTLSRAELNYEHGTYKNIHYGDILIKFNAYIDITDKIVPYINETVKISSKSNSLNNGDIIFADTAEDYTVGKATEIESADKVETFAGLHTIPCRPKFTFAQRYLGYFVNSQSYHNQLLPFIQGIKVSSISKSQIVKTEIHYPSLSEQNKIAQFLSLIDKRIKIQNKIISHYETLIKGLCNNIFKHHKTDCLSNLVKCKSSTLQENEVKMSDDGQYNVFGASGIIATTENYQFDESAILVLKDGSKAGKIQYASGMYSVVGTSVILIPNDSRDARYIYFAMMAIDFEKYKVGSGIPHIYFKDYSAEKIYYPAAKQRERIVKTLDAYETKINIEKGILSALQKQKVFLLQSMFI